MTVRIRDADGQLNGQVVVALIGGITTLLAAVIAGIFGLAQLRAADGAGADQVEVPAGRAPAAPVAPSPGTPEPSAGLEVAIDGPAQAPLDRRTYFTVVSDGAERVEWSIAGFGGDVIEPFRLSEQIYVEPVDPERVGDTFVLVVTGTGGEGAEASATHTFVVTAPPAADG